MKKYILIFACLSAFISTSALQAQYRWHIVLPDRVDSVFRGITSISCYGDACTASEVLYTASPSSYDSNVIIHSTDGGLTWTPLDSALPQWSWNSSGKGGIYLSAVQQIDSLHAIAVDQAGRQIDRTPDNWKTVAVDTAIDHTALGTSNFLSIDFSDPREGMTEQGSGFFGFTSDSGHRWSQVIFHLATSYHSYGSGKFRVFKSPTTIYTTNDYWKGVDTSIINLSGPFQDTNLHPSSLIFGNGDTLGVRGSRWDENDFHYSAALVMSTDLGVHWKELPVPPNNGIEAGSYDLATLDWNFMVLAGKDSVGRIVMSTNNGVSWSLDTVPLSNGQPYFNITHIAVTGSGRVLATIILDSNFINSSVLAYLEEAPSSVSNSIRESKPLTVYPDPAMNMLNLSETPANISILDPLGRSYTVPQMGSTLDISSLSAGVYFVSDGKTRAKFVKE